VQKALSKKALLWHVPDRIHPHVRVIFILGSRSYLLANRLVPKLPER